MSKFLDPFRFLLISLAGWMNQRQLNAIEYLARQDKLAIIPDTELSFSETSS